MKLNFLGLFQISGKNVARLHLQERALAQEIQLGSPDYFSSCEGGDWG